MENWSIYFIYWANHKIGPLYVTSSYSNWILCRGVSGFATDCPCDVWCRGLTTCLPHVGLPFVNRFLNTSWAVGLTYKIVYLHFFILTYAIIYVLIHHISFWLYLNFLNILYFSKCSCTNIFHRRSFVLSILIAKYILPWAVLVSVICDQTCHGTSDTYADLATNLYSLQGIFAATIRNRLRYCAVF